MATIKKINISQVDTIFANGSYPIEFLLYYRNGLKTENVRSALSRLSSSFWPIFGEYDAGTIHFERYSEEVCFSEHVSNEEFDIDDTNQNLLKKYGYLIPPHLKKLFFLKIIQYKNGTVLIPKLNHLAGDGYSYFYFLSALAKMSQDGQNPIKRKMIQTLFKPDHQRTKLKVFQLNDLNLEAIREDANLTIKFEEFSKKSIREMIRDVAANSNQKVSTNDILSALVIKKSVEIQSEHFGDDILLTIPIDVRRQIKEYGPKYFGNGLMFNEINFSITDIKTSDINNIALKIRKNMPEVNKEFYLDYLNSLEEIIARGQTHRLRPYDPNQGCLVTNLSKLPATKLDFGSGNPDFLFPLTLGKNSAAILADTDNFIIRLAY